MKEVIIVSLLLCLIGCATTKTKEFGYVHYAPSEVRISDPKVSQNFILSPKEIVEQYENVGTYYTTYHVDERYYYIVPDRGIVTFWIPEKSATVIVDGWTGKIIKDKRQPKALPTSR